MKWWPWSKKVEAPERRQLKTAVSIDEEGNVYHFVLSDKGRKEKPEQSLNVESDDADKV